MRVGHRRTGSETLYKLRQQDCYQINWMGTQKCEQITKLINASSDKIKNKVIQVDRFNDQNIDDYGLIQFQFGYNRNFTSQKFLKNYQRHSLIDIPEIKHKKAQKKQIQHKAKKRNQLKSNIASDDRHRKPSNKMSNKDSSHTKNSKKKKNSQLQSFPKSKKFKMLMSYLTSFKSKPTNNI